MSRDNVPNLREERAEREHQAKLELERARQTTIRAQLQRASITAAHRDFSPISQPRSVPAPKPPNPPRSANATNPDVDPTKRKPPVNVKAQPVTAESKTAPAPKERKNAAQRASAG